MLFDAYSDAFKDLNGFRPRGALAERFLNAPESEQDRLLQQVYADLRAELEREAAQRDAFKAKLSALGLDPERFSYLWDEPV